MIFVNALEALDILLADVVRQWNIAVQLDVLIDDQRVILMDELFRIRLRQRRFRLRRVRLIIHIGLVLRR